MPTTTPPLTGQDINVAARATRLVLVAGLDTVDLAFDDWIVINLVGTGQTDDEPTLRARLLSGLGIEAEAVDRRLSDLAAAGLIQRDANALALTPAGARRWSQGQAVVAELVASLYAGLTPEDLATAQRVLREVTARAQMMLAA